jgi:deoxyribonuclease V
MSGHVWPEDSDAAGKIQNELSGKVKMQPLRRRLSYVAGVDAAYGTEAVVAVASLFDYPSLVHRADAISRDRLRFPYLPGLLAFREGRAIIDAVTKLERPPDVILVDGQGTAHPLGFGIASHIGVLLDIPTIGCAKSRLVGAYAEPGPEKGEWSDLVYKGKVVGAVLRTRDNVKPVFVSPGHLTDLTSSIAIVLRCLTHYRLPEPIRRADHLSKELVRSGFQ